MRRVPFSSGRMPKCCSEYMGDHRVPVRNSAIGTSRKNPADSVTSTTTIPTRGQHRNQAAPEQQQGDDALSPAPARLVCRGQRHRGPGGASARSPRSTSGVERPACHAAACGYIPAGKPPRSS